MKPKQIIHEFSNKAKTFRKEWLIAGILAVIGIALVRSSLNEYKRKIGVGMETEHVLVASRAFPQNYVIQKGDLSLQPIPSSYLPLGAILNYDEEKVVGTTTIRPIAQGEMMLWSALDVSLENNGPARRIAKGYRAIAVRVDVSTAVGRAVQPGDHVDLIMTGKMPGEVEPTTFTLLQNVAVLDVGQPVEGAANRSYSTITLMVLPKEVAIIAHAEQNGRITLALRNPEDHQTPRDLPMVAINQLAESAFRNSIQQERNDVVQVIRGGKVSFEQ